MNTSSQSKKKKITLIISSNGGVFQKLYPSLKKNYNFQIISDRENNFSKFAYKEKLNYHLIKEINKEKYNNQIYMTIRSFNPDKIILFYTKIIPEIVHKNYLTLNIHNSYLPHYAGLGAIKKVLQNNNKIICSTLHTVTTKIDKGKIIAQCSSAVEKKDLNYIKKEAFIHRVIIFLEALKKKKNWDYKIIKSKYLLHPSNLDKSDIKILNKIL